MQKTLIALAVAGLMSGTAFAETSVKIGGKFDAGYQFINAAGADTLDASKQNGTSTGGSSTATLGDGSATSSRITIQAKEDLAPGWYAMVDLDLRFGTIEEGKNLTTTGGLNSNDKKAMYLSSPFGTLRWGVMNMAQQQYWDYEEKPYMVNVKDLEIVKYGVSQKRDTSLTSRNTEYDTPILTIGNMSNRLKFSYAFGDSRKAGSNDTDNTTSGDTFVIAETGVIGKFINWSFSTGHRRSITEGASSTTTGFSGTGAGTGMHYSENNISIHPIDGLKIGMNYNIFKGAGDTSSENGLFKEKNTNFVIAYNFGSKAQIGIERSHLNDLSTNRNSGKGWMIGGSYFISKSTFIYLGWQKDDYARNVKSISGGYSGTGTNFMTTFNKVDQTYTRFGIAKEF